MQDQIYILGSGIAGTTLSIELMKAGIEHRVYDDPKFSRSSRIAAGLANPVVLKRQKWVHKAELFMPASRAFFKSFEKEHGQKILHPAEIEHIFHRAGEVNDWLINSSKPHLSQHLGPILKEEIPDINSPQGRGLLQDIFWLDTQRFIEIHKNKLRKKAWLIEEVWPGFENLPESKVIYCNGHLLRESHPHLAKAFSPTKGELMIISGTSLPEDRILHAGVFTLPLGKGLFKIGASYAHQNISDEASAKGLSFLEEKLQVFYRGSYQIEEQLAGVRPNIRDRKPLLGRINDSEYVFNGMGSRGVLMAPYLAQHFLDFLLKDGSLKEEWNLNRFI